MAQPNFSGVWLNTDIPDVEGCTTAQFFEKGLEMGFVMRNMSRAAGYGKDKLQHDVTDDGKIFVNKMNMPEPKTYTWQCDGVEHPDNGQGESYIATWVGEKLVLAPGAGAPATTFTLTRYMDGETMVCDLHYPNKPGITMTRRFTKQ